ncbi:WD40-repeat-containing domain protein [Polychytrium aggregatum]|uniref:WD40-repeat-containing domain protein n=1 Tax=Polychytrium aggregatum TaxID=110093 RepID=UPI0022FDF197|nr:WD40-repeat-containing domain protein [Polychytrium aggregatum]KAI9207535.1 WD40-repeat-containing domain protein [Polychytrium aggregatum]
MFCSISGEVPSEPVVSKKTGNVFERRLIIKYIADNGKDPITGDALTEDDLISLKQDSKYVKPRPPTLNSVPALLSLFQSEWDSVMLETHQLKQQYHQVRQELSNALYENDAAKRVIARLAKERDEARAALATIKATLGDSAAVQTSEPAQPQAMEIDQDDGISKAIQDKMTEKSQSLQNTRRKRKAPADLATAEQLSKYGPVLEVPSLGLSTNPGILALDLLEDEVAGVPREWILTGGRDGHSIVIEKNSGKVVADMKAHTKKINDVAWHNLGGHSGMFFTAGADKQVKICQVDLASTSKTKTATLHTLKAHGDEVTGLSLQATGDYLVSVGLDSAWAFSEIETGRVVAKVESEEVTKGYSSVKLHPDGLILGTGTCDSVVRLWDVKSRTNVGALTGHVGQITSLSFSENGYYLATAADGHNVVKLWDLRKLASLHDIEVPVSDGHTGGVHRVQFDYNRQFLGVAAGHDARVYVVKQWDQVAHYSNHSANVTGIKFGSKAQYIVTSGLDRKVTVLGPEA